MVFAALAYFGMVIDLFSILLTDKNLVLFLGDDKIIWHYVLAWMWVAPTYIFGIYVGITILKPKRKWFFMTIYLVLGAIYEICIFFDFEGSIALEYPLTPGENLIEGTYVIGSPVFYIIVIFTLSFIMMGFGLFIKSIQSTEVLRKKYLIFALAIFMVVICGILEGLIPTGIGAIFTRIGTISGFWLMYLAVREEPEERKKARPKKEIAVEESIFRISKRPDHLTEEEVSISKEKKICLVCKGKLGGLMFMCKECGALYCEKCSSALVELENACWACNSPIDPSKPVKTFKLEDEATNLKILKRSNKPTKKPK